MQCPIVSCLMPPTMFVAVPDITPLPPTTQVYGAGLASALVNSSVVPRLLGQCQPRSRWPCHLSNDTDTSLNDYLQPEPGYVITVTLSPTACSQVTTTMSQSWTVTLAFCLCTQLAQHMLLHPQSLRLCTFASAAVTPACACLA